MRQSSLLSSGVAVSREVASEYDDVKVVADGIQSVIAIATALTDGTFDNVDLVIEDPLKGNINELGPIAQEIATVAGLSESILTVEADSGNIGLVADDIASVKVVADNISRISVVYNNMAVIQAVVANEANIAAVAGNKVNIDTVVDNMDDIEAVANESGNISNVGNNVDDVVVVSENMGHVLVTAHDIDAIKSVAALDPADVDVVSDNIDDISAVADNIEDVSALVPNIDAISQAAADTVVINAVASEPLRSAILGAEANATKAELEAWEAEADKRTTESLAHEEEDTPVKVWTSNGDGTFSVADAVPTEFSAKHYRDKTSTIRGGLEDFNRYGIVYGMDVSINADDNTTFDVASGEYYIGDTPYEYAGAVGIETGMPADRSVLVLGIDGTQELVYKYGEGFSDAELLEVVELGALATVGGPNEIVAANESAFDATNVVARLNVRQKNYVETIFDDNAAKLVTSAVPLQLSIEGGFLNDAEMDSKEVLPASDVGGVEVKHDGAGNWTNTAQAPLVVTTDAYDNGTGMVPSGTGRYLFTDVLRSSRTGTIYKIEPQGEFLTFSQALNAPYSSNPLVASKGLDVVPIARIVSKTGDAQIRFIQDLRVVIEKVRVIDRVTDGTKNLSAFGNGGVIETMGSDVSSDGTDVTFSYYDPNNGGLTCQFDEQNFYLPNGSIVLVEGTDTVPVRNFIYVELQSGIATAVVSTSGFPSTAHCPLAEVTLQSAASVQADGPLAYQEWVDHIVGPEGLGHLHDINSWIRAQDATYVSGLDVVVTPDVGGLAGPADVVCTYGSGVIRQLHKISSDAIDIAIDGAYVLNDPNNPMLKVFNLNHTGRADGGIIGNRRFNIVTMIAVNADGAKLFLNMPVNDYGNDDEAIYDIENYSVYDIPAFLKGKTTLGHRITIRRLNNGDLEVLAIRSLRGLSQATAGGISGNVKNVYGDEEFAIHDDVDITKTVKFEVGQVSSGVTRELVVPDEDGTIVLEANVYTRGEIDAKDSVKVSIADIQDVLTAVDTDKPLSANQGKILKDYIDAINDVLSSDDVSLDELQEIVDFIKLNRADLDALSISSIAGLQDALDEKIDALDAYTRAEIDAKDDTKLDKVGGTITGDLQVDGNVNGRDFDADGVKLDTVEENAKDDQTGAEIKALYEAEADTNVLNDADKAKYDGYEAEIDSKASQTDLDTTNTNVSSKAEQIEVDEIKEVLGTSNKVRYDKKLASLDVIEMVYTDGDLVTVRYDGDNGVDMFYRDVLSNVDGNLVEVKHYFGTIDLLTENAVTDLVYLNGSLSSATYSEV